MSVSKAVRMALKKAGKQNADLAQLWGYTLNATSNKFQWERWTGKELSEVAEMTGGQLAFVYPDGTQITIPQEDTKKDAKAAAQRKKGEHPATASGGSIAGREVTRNKRAVRGTVASIEGADTPKNAKAPTAAKKKAPAKPKKAKAPAVMEEQISFFEEV